VAAKTDMCCRFAELKHVIKANKNPNMLLTKQMTSITSSPSLRMYQSFAVKEHIKIHIRTFVFIRNTLF